jgi:hypothetical protein
MAWPVDPPKDGAPMHQPARRAPGVSNAEAATLPDNVIQAMVSVAEGKLYVERIKKELAEAVSVPVVQPK